MTITLRPDYKPGDDEFDFDATAVRDGHDFVYNVDHLQAAFNRLKRNYYAACRQAEYWRHEAVTAGCATDTDADYKHFDSGKSRPGVVRNSLR